MKNRDIYWRRYKIQETLYIGQWWLSPLQSRHLGTSHSSPSCHQLPHCIFLNLIIRSEISCLSRMILVLGKTRSCTVPNLGYRELSHLGDLMFDQKTLHKMWCMSRHVVMMKQQVTSCPLSIYHLLCGLLNRPSCFHGGMFKVNTKFDALLAQSFWMQWPHSTRAHSIASTTPTD